jgi:hypothetical protein
MSNANWKRNEIQFPRLIAELEACGAFTPGTIDDLCDSMDLKPGEVRELIERAQAEWDRIKDSMGCRLKGKTK